MGGVAVGSGAVVSPGVINTIGRHHRLIFGELDGRISGRAEGILDLFKRTSFEGVLSRDIVLEGWEKFTVFVAHSGVSALTRLPIGKLRDDPEVFGLYEAAMREVIAVGRAEGVRFPPDTIERQLAFLRGLGPDHRPSMAVDLMQGNRLELTWLAGKVVELGRRYAIPTPINGVALSH
jgi:2-dehydropantoate 2-reductase